jgi:hypothetical protein
MPGSIRCSSMVYTFRRPISNRCAISVTVMRPDVTSRECLKTERGLATGMVISPQQTFPG